MTRLQLALQVGGPDPLYVAAWGAGSDAANARMRYHGRTSWDAADYDFACAAFHEVYDGLQAEQAATLQETHP